LDSDAGLAVAEALTNKKSLKTVELNGKLWGGSHHVKHALSAVICDATGNAFGEDGIELLRGSLEAKGQLEVLGSLSDDEGLEEEEDEEEEENEEEDEDDKETSDAVVVKNNVVQLEMVRPHSWCPRQM
jgi:hypothetical protein